LLSFHKYSSQRLFQRSNWQNVLFSLSILAIVLYEAQGEGDFKIFLSASEDLFIGKNIYKEFYNDWFHYYYSVFFAIILFPFTLLPLYAAKFIWLLINVYLVIRIWKAIVCWLPIEWLEPKYRLVFGIMSFAFIFRFLLDNIHLAQMTILILFLTLEGIRLILEGKEISGSFLIAIGIDIKLLPILFIGYLVYRNKWKSALYILLFVGFLLMIPTIFIRFQHNNFLILERWSLLNPLNQEHVLDTTERSFHSITTFLSVLLVENCGDYHALPLKRNIANLSLHHLHYIITMARLILVLATLYFMRSLPFKSCTSKIQTLYEISYICILIPLIFPHQQHYAFLFIFPATSYLIFYNTFLFYNNKESNSTTKTIHSVTLFVSFLLTSSHLILGQFNEYYDHYKILTYGILILIILLAFSPPKKIAHKKVLA
jgi:hypothetical protein